MLRVIQNRDSGSAKGYYTGKAEAGYYLGAAQEMVGEWGGKAAQLLGLSGQVERPAFEQLCDNRHPLSGERLTLRQKKNRTTGYDFNWHACKSASLLYGLTGDPAILAAFRQAVAETMGEIEALIQTRVRKGGRQEDRTVGNMSWAEFLHFTARPVGGTIDPHLHAHCFVFNAVFDPVERQWKAGQFRELKANTPEFQRRFHDRFARNLAALGYPIARHGSGWEIAGIARSTVEKFSRRTRQVEAFAESHGITDPKQKDGIGARTRERKRSDASMGELRREWASRLTGQEQAALAVITSRRGFMGVATPLPDHAASCPPGRRFASLRERQRRMHHERLEAARTAWISSPERDQRHA